MNIKLVLLLFSGLVTGNINAQSNPRNPITTGVKGGLNLTNISSGAKSQDIKPSFHIGGLVEFPLSYYKQYALQIELQYSNQGYNGKEITKRDPITNEVVEKNKMDNVSLHYINIPILFKYYVSENFAIEVGPQIGFLMGANGTFDLYKFNEAREYIVDTPNGLEQELEMYGYRNNDYKNFYDTVDYGLSFGATYNLKNRMFISAKYYLGLKDIYKADNHFSKLSVPPGLPEEFEKEINRINKELDLKPTKNSVFQISVGYRF